ncbi:MAG TPA: PHB depolymerase family esterase, partial [Candidatus Binataceae bacterium]|nr:PHB depolymerase family esterase [Candidatus Binataceae bacterium]
MTFRKAVAALVFAIVAFTRPAFAADQCTPFGDPPAQINHGFFASALAAHNPICFGGRVLGPWKDSDGTDRYACIYEPEQHSRDTPLPLLVFLHGSLATADSIKLTGLTSAIETGDLGEKKPGFILLAPEGRYTSHHYPGLDSNAMGWDNWYRQLSPSGDVTIAGTTYKENVDAAAIHHFIQDEIATGEVDASRVYLTGWSNGAAMALLYALNRQSIAAAAVYSAPDPFGAFNDPCMQTPVPRAPTSNAEVQIFNPHIALMHVRNSCDIGGICPNGNTFAQQMRSISISLDDVLLNAYGTPISACDDTCGTSPNADGDVSVMGQVAGFGHHVRWPSAWNARMLAFL